MSLLEILASPVPVIAGIPCSREFVIENNLCTEYEQCLFIFADTQEIVANEEYRAHIVRPKLGGLADKIRLFYEHFSKDPDDALIRSAGVQQTGVSNFYMMAASHRPKQIDLEMTEKIAGGFKEALQSQVLKHVPISPIYTSHGDHVHFFAHLAGLDCW